MPNQDRAPSLVKLVGEIQACLQIFLQISFLPFTLNPGLTLGQLTHFTQASSGS